MKVLFNIKTPTMKKHYSSPASITDLLQKIRKALASKTENHNYIHELLDELKSRIGLNADLADQLSAA